MRREKQPLDAFAGFRGRAFVENTAQVPGLANEVELLALHAPSVPFPGDVQRVVVVEDVSSVLPTYVQQGYSIAVEPWKNRRGTCTILQDDLGTRVCLMERHGAVGVPRLD